MYNYSNYYTPFLHLQGLTIKRLTMNDIVEHSKKQISNKRMRKRQTRGITDLLWGAFIDGTNVLFDYSKYLLPGTIFFFKFLEWWYTENRVVSPNMPLPPPPEPPKRALGGIAIPSDKSLCPICEKKRNNPAMASSGFVYCYPCILQWVETHGNCPITHIPCTPEQLRRIFDDV
eukprot:TRINITY_DN9223_c0_g1_i1.p1 TRINITY_DN9223_c0_g1~~TRINITY_DN9223_c0_g1_i1.p1  ORF type:complete len:174 (-),score=16.57 TRINITY_DN9223_c0_g1_i1:79-600(-)